MARKTNRPLPKKKLEAITRRVSVLYAMMRAESEWQALPWKKRNERFCAMLDRVLREYRVGNDEWALYKSIVGSWLSKRSARKRARMLAEQTYYAAQEENLDQDFDQMTTETPDLFPDSSSYPCADYSSFP